MTKNMKLVRQPEGSGLCLAACVAMLTGEPLSTVMQEGRLLKSEDGVEFLPDNEAAKFLAGRFLIYGLWLTPQKFDGEETSLQLDLPLDQQPAILSVDSKTFKDSEHAVVWDNKRQVVLDPQSDDPKKLGDYSINCWIPITKIK